MGYNLLKRLVSTNRDHESSSSTTTATTTTTTIPGSPVDWPDSFFDHDDSLAKKAVRRQRTRSWMPAHRKKMPSTPEALEIRRVNSAQRISTDQISPPITDDLHLCSSPASINSNEAATTTTNATNIPIINNTNTNTNTRGNATPHVAFLSRSASPQPLLCPPRSDSSNRHHSMPPRRPSRPGDVKGLLSPDSATFPDGLSVRSESRASSERSRNSHESAQALRLENVEQLILETDEAFKALDSALIIEAKPASAGLERANSPSLPMRTGPLPATPMHKHSQSVPLPLGLAKKTPPKSMTSSPLASPTRRASVKKPRGKPGKRTSGGRWRSSSGASRWALSENVTGILTGQRFKRIEADEMLTPSQIKDLSRYRRMSEEKEAAQEEQEEEGDWKEHPSDEEDEKSETLVHETTEKPRLSVECNRWSSQSLTPVEPFHLDDLPTRIGASGVVLVENKEMEAVVPCQAVMDLVTPDDEAPPRDFVPMEVSPDEEKAPMGLPLLPPKNPARYGPPPLHKKLPPIPTRKPSAAAGPVPDLMVTTPDNTQLQPAPVQKPRKKFSLRTEENRDFLYLKGTPYTLTRPSFRHGPITFSKAELGIGAPTMDDTLDWTAFQMAILGYNGDFLADSGRDEELKQNTDLYGWFDSFGFDSHGELVPDDTPPSRSSSLSSSPSTIESDAEPPIPVSVEFASGFWNTSADAGHSLDADRFYGNPAGLKRWTGTRPKRYNSSDSPPPSPMLELVVPAALNGQPASEPVPMGYNLHHDLGDFLRWEAENVYVPEFCSTP